MPRYEKSEIRKGMYLELDCPIRTNTYTRPPQYGDTFAEINQRLDTARVRLEDLMKEI